MPNRLIIPLLVAASVAFARGYSTPKEPITASTTTQNQQQKGAPIASSFSVDVRDELRFQLSVANNTRKMIELRFPNGQTHEFVVIDADGNEVWRWSDGRMFTQSLQNKLVKARDTAVYASTWDAEKMHGRFTAIATLMSDNHPIEQRVEFALK